MKSEFAVKVVISLKRCTVARYGLRDVDTIHH